jgi:hypothetical protein
MQVVIPLAPQVQNEDLRYCLRSIDKFLTGYDGVTIIGKEIPDWVTGIEHIALPDLTAQKQLNIKRKIIAALTIYEEIFYTADDVFLLKHFVANKFPYLYDGELCKRNIEGSAARVKAGLVRLGKTFYNYDCHSPVIYRRDFADIISKFDPSCIVKSAYFNYLEVKGTQVRDAKIVSASMTLQQIEKHIRGLHCFSSGDYTLKTCLPILKRLFPDKSKFEVYE